VPVGQPQTPAVHDWPVGHTLPQRPQLFVSVEVLTQRLVQYVCPVAQPQTPARQSWPVGHTLPHVVPPGQPQTPPTHDWPVGHTRPQEPQLLTSALVLMHRESAAQ
jgi:hypothetical protein